MRDWMLRELAPEQGQTILELAAGLGDVRFAAAELLGEEGRLISTDFSPVMVDIARRRSAELGLRNVGHRVMDPERIELEDDAVDGVLCRFGYMLMPERRVHVSAPGAYGAAAHSDARLPCSDAGSSGQWRRKRPAQYGRNEPLARCQSVALPAKHDTEGEEATQATG